MRLASIGQGSTGIMGRRALPIVVAVGIVVALLGVAVVAASSFASQRVAANATQLHWITVADDGPGVPQEIQDQLFERYVHDGRRALLAGSAGLGLAIAKTLMSEMGGDVRHHRGDGLTEFIATIPSAAIGAEVPHEVATSGVTNPGPRNDRPDPAPTGAIPAQREATFPPTTHQLPTQTNGSRSDAPEDPWGIPWDA